MQTYYRHLIEYAKFIISFKTRYEELYQKYHPFLEMDSEGSGRIVIRHDVEISPMKRLVLGHIIKEYYTALEN